MIFENTSLWEPLLRELRGKRVCIIVPQGNVGDEFILAGTQYLLNAGGVSNVSFVKQQSVARHKISCDVLCWGGGGNVCGRYRMSETIKFCWTVSRDIQAKFICLPQSIERDGEVMRLFDLVFLREVVSAGLFNDSRLIPDLALANRLRPAEPKMEKLQLFRNDREASGRFEAKDPRRGLSLTEFIELAGSASRLETDLLHFSVAAMLQGVNVTLRGCDWHKNEAMYRTWLHYFPNTEFIE